MNERSKTADELLGLNKFHETEKNIDDESNLDVNEDDFGEGMVAMELPDLLSKDDKAEDDVEDTYDDSVVVKKKAKKIDLSNVNILETTELEKDVDLRAALYGNKSLFQIVAAQSGYMAKMTPLVHKDIISLLYSNLSRYEYRKAVFKVVYDKIYAISSGKMSFEEWLKNTSVEDIETFYYGMYCATFPDEGKFTFTCPECEDERTLSIKHGNLFKTTDKTAMKKLIKDVTDKSRDEESRKKFSLVGKTEAFELTDSKIIVDIRVPSLWDSLELLRAVPEREIDRDTLSATNMLYIKRFLIPSKRGSGYTEQNKSLEVLKIIDNLSIDDAVQLQDLVSEKVDEHRISYSIKNLKCPRCGKVIEDTPISVEDILFTLIFEKAQ